MAVKQFSCLIASVYWIAPGLIILPTPSALACSCAPPSDTQFRFADVVFSGKVLDWKDSKTGTKHRSGANPIAWIFAVDKVFKGNISAQTQVQSTTFEGTCGITFRIGERYQVYARRQGNTLSTTLCVGNQLLSLSIEELLRRPPLPETRVEINAFFAGRTTRPIPGESRYIVPKGQIFCPYKARYRWLSDWPFLGNLSTSIGSTASNFLPDQAPWLIATLPQALQPGVDIWPNLPYNARLIGYLGEPKFAHCPKANRIFVVEKVLKVYETDPDPKFYPTKFPQDYLSWLTFHDAELGYKILYPPGWKLERLPKRSSLLSAIAFRSTTWPNYPVIVRVRPYPHSKDQTTMLSGGPFTQWLPDKTQTQQLSGSNFEYQVGENRRMTLVRFRTGDRLYEVMLTYPIGFRASQELLNHFIIMASKFQLDDPSQIFPTSEFKSRSY